MGFDHLRRHKMQVALGAEAETAAQGGLQRMGEGTFVGTRGNDKVTPKPAICEATLKPSGSTPPQTFNHRASGRSSRAEADIRIWPWSRGYEPAFPGRTGW